MYCIFLYLLAEETMDNDDDDNDDNEATTSTSVEPVDLKDLNPRQFIVYRFGCVILDIISESFNTL